MRYLPMTDEQAEALYHRAFQPEFYRAATFGIAWVLSYPDEALLHKMLSPTTTGSDIAEYIKLNNLLIDAAQEACGHSLFSGAAWLLALQLRETASHSRASAEQVDRMFALVEQYVERYRIERQVYQADIEKDPLAKAQYLATVAYQYMLNAARASSEIPSRFGRTAYHVLSASVELALTTISLLKNQESDKHLLAYAADKFLSSLKHLTYALSELMPIPYLPVPFAAAYDVLMAWLEPRSKSVVGLIAIYNLEMQAFSQLAAASKGRHLSNKAEIVVDLGNLREMLSDMQSQAPLSDALADLERFVQKMAADYHCCYFWLRREE